MCVMWGLKPFTTTALLYMNQEPPPRVTGWARRNKANTHRTFITLASKTLGCYRPNRCCWSCRGCPFFEKKTARWEGLNAFSRARLSETYTRAYIYIYLYIYIYIGTAVSMRNKKRSTWWMVGNTHDALLL